MLRVCVIGQGPIGNLHTRIYQTDPLAQLVGVCDLIRQRREAGEAEFHVPGFSDAQTMLSELKPDLVSVATGGFEYSSDHFEPVMQSLESGAHVLCEKPISNDIRKAEEMVCRAQELRLCFGIDLNHRFTPAALLAKQWQKEDRIGHLLFINMAIWIKNRAESSSFFHLKALHPHSVDIMRYFGGDIEAVHCFATKAPGRTLWSTAQINMRFKNGAVGHLTGSYDIERGHPMERCEVAGLKGRLVIDDMFRELVLYPAGNLQKTVFSNPVFGGLGSFDDTFRNRIHAFLEQVDQGVAPEEINGSGADGLAAQKVLQAAIESLESESVVYVA
jgi:predicted dehydrogenase